MTTTIAGIIIRIIVIFILSAIVISLCSMLFLHEIRIDTTRIPHSTVLVASDGGPMPTCGTGHLPPCGPKDDGIVRKIISILIG